MSDLMHRILQAKAQTRKELARLPFAEKLVIVEQLRDRSRLIASSPLRKQSEAEAARRRQSKDYRTRLLRLGRS